MGSLKGKSISKTYQRILQTSAEVLNSTLRSVETGNGNSTAMNLSTDRAEFLKVGIGTGGTQPDGLLHVLSVSAGAVTASTYANQLILENSGDAGISILSGVKSSGNIYFGDANDNDVGRIFYDHSNDSMSFATSGAEVMKLDKGGNLNISGTLSQSDDRFELKEMFEKVPSLRSSLVTQATSATTEVVFDAKLGVITMQAVDLAATDTVEFTFTNSHIFGTSSQVLVNLHEAGTLADNAMVNVLVHDVTNGSCKIRLGTNGTDIASQTFTLFFIIDPYITPNQNFVLSGLNTGSTQVSSTVGRGASFAGIKLTTGSTDNDRSVILPRDSNTELPAGYDSSAWSSVGFGTENKTEFSCAFSTSGTISNEGFWVGLKLTEVGTYATDANQAYFIYGADDTLGAFTTNANLHFVHSISGVDYITDLGIAIAASTVYRLRIIFDENRKVSVFVNNTQYGLTSSTTAGGVIETVKTTKSLQMTDDINLIPVVGVQTFTTVSKGVQLGYIKISRDLYE